MKPKQVPGMTKRPKVAPFNSCIACYRGDVTTAIHFEGSAEFIIAGVHRLAGLTIEESTATFKEWWAEHEEAIRGMIPTGRVQVAVRLCAECAAKTGAKVEQVSAEPREVFTYVGPDKEEEDDA